MKWPWVSRAELETEQALRIAAEQTSDKLFKQVWELGSIVEKMSQNGIKEIVATVASTIEPSPVARIIREQAQGPDGREDLGLARHLRTYASKLRREKKSDAEIAAALVAWQTTEQET